jgi:hypothetical protein
VSSSKSRSFLLAIACAALLAGAIATTAQAGHKVFFPSACTNVRFKPKHLIAACGDAGLQVTGISWSHYGQKSAHGNGTAATNTCTPNCAAGNFEKDPAAVRLFRPRLCKALGIFLFTRLTVIYTSTRPSGSSKSVTFPFPCSIIESGSG